MLLIFEIPTMNHKHKRATNKLNLFIGAYLGYYTLEIQYRS